MRRKVFVHAIKINLDRDTAEALQRLHDESGWARNQIVRLGLRMFISEYRRLGIGKGMGQLRNAQIVDPA